DLAGNAGSGVNSSVVDYDLPGFGVLSYSVASGQPNPTNIDSFSFEIEFDTPINPATFTADDLFTTGTTVTGTLVPVIVGGGSGPYTITYTGAASDGVVAVTVDLSGIEDTVGVAGLGLSSTEVITYDATAASVSLFEVPAAQPNPTNVDSFVFEITFSEDIDPSSFTNASLDFTGSTVTGTLIPLITGSGAGPYVVALSGATSDGDVWLSIDTTGILDLAGNAMTGVVGPLEIVYDTTSPTVILFDDSVGQPDPTNVDFFSVEVTFDEDITTGTLTALNVNTSNSTVGGTLVPVITGTGAGPYVITITGATSSGVVEVYLELPGILDLAGNSMTGTTAPLTFTYDIDGPGIDFVQAATGQSDPTNVLPIFFEVLFTEPIDEASFTAADLSLAGSTAAGGGTIDSVTGTGAGPYTVEVSGFTGSGDVRLLVNTAAIADVLGNLGSTTLEGTVVYDIEPLSAGSFTTAPAQPNPTNIASFSYEILFAEPIDESTFTVDDVFTTGSTVGGPLTLTLTGTGAGPYTLTFVGASNDGFVIPSVDLPGITDLLGNPGDAIISGPAITYDTTPPTVATLDLATGQANPTNALPILFEVTFSEALTTGTLTTSDFTFAGTTAAGTPIVSSVTGSGSGPYTVEVDGLTGSGLVVLNLSGTEVIDLAGNVGTGTDSASADYDIDGPAVVTLDKTAAQPDPATTLPIAFEVVFDQAINPATFTAADISFAGTTAPGTPVAQNLTGTGAGPYTFEVIGLTGNGDVVVTVLATSIADPLGNNGPANSGTATVEYQLPVAASIISYTVATGQPNPTNTLPIQFEVVFDQPINSATFTGADISLAGTSALGTFTPAVISGSGAGPYVVQVTGSIAVDGDLVTQVLGFNILDANNNTVSNSSTTASVTIDRSRPQVVTFQTTPTPSIFVRTQPANLSITFNKPINFTTFNASDFSVTLGTATGIPTVLVTGGIGAGPYTLQVSGLTSDGTFTVNFDQAGVSDFIGNTGTGVQSLALTLDSTGPNLISIAAAPTQTVPALTLPIRVRATFNEPVLGFTPFDVAFTGTTAPGTPTASSVVSLGGGVYEITINGLSGPGDVVVGINVPGTTDLAGNPGLANPITFTIPFGAAASVENWIQSPY
ncbi:MAG: hypothetical protein SFY68_06435, partial [Candidatus Sumerlaeia bacterium]|nr:hypothetical protein [Candidatus Sumerlaeia bacterium]